MPKVMMIGKVSKLKSRTRRAGSFKGSLGTVVLEGSRAKSRRYGMGNIAGSPAQHMESFRASLATAATAAEYMQKSRECSGRLSHAMLVLESLGAAKAQLPYMSKDAVMQFRNRLAELNRAATMAVQSCSTSTPTVRTKSTMSGARRRRRSR